MSLSGSEQEHAHRAGLRSVGQLATFILAVVGTSLIAFGQDSKPKLKTMGRAPAWASQSWFLRRQIEKPWALRGGNVVDVRTGRVMSNATIVIAGDMIQSVESNAAVEGMEVVDTTGLYIVPGFFDLHAHVIPRSLFFPTAPEPEHALKTLIEHGVTTIRLLPLYGESAVEWASRVNTGNLIGPTIVPVSGIFEKEAQRTSLGFGDPAMARAWVLKEALLGSRWIKVYNSMDEPSLQAIIDAARSFGMKVCGHTEDVPPHRASALGIGSIEHAISIPLSCLRDDLEPTERMDLGARMARRWTDLDEGKLTQLLLSFRANGTAWVPTLVVSEAMNQSGKHDGKPIDATMDRNVLDASLEKAAQSVVRFHRDGGLVGVGTDFPIDGVPVGKSVHREMELLVEHGGATPREALEIATICSARILGFDGIVGTIEAGRIANLVVLKEDPLECISRTQGIVYVIHDGRIRVRPNVRAGKNESVSP